MNVTVSAGNFGGTIPAIASKSYAHRLLICGAFSSEPCRISCATMSKDIMATAECLRALGADILRTEESFDITPIDKSRVPASPVLDCGESGSTLRFMLPVVCALGVNATFIMHGRLAQRPLSPLYEELQSHGITLSEQGKSPLTVCGKLEGRNFTIPADVSSQFISGLMLALPLVGGGTVTLEGKTESGSYIDITADCLRKAGVNVGLDGKEFSISGGYDLPETTTVEGDWSNAAFWLCAGAVGKKPVTVTGLDPASAQGDRKIVDIIKKLDCNVMETKNSVTALPSKLRGENIDAGDIPDLVPIISVLAASATGETHIYNAGRLRLKESDRLKAAANVMSTFAVYIKEKADGLIIQGGKPLSGGTVDGWNDHRIAMTAAVASLITAAPVTIIGAECVSKSYPGFFDDFKRLGGEVSVEEEQT